MEKNTKGFPIQSIIKDIEKYNKNVEKREKYKETHGIYDPNFIMSGIALNHKLQRKEGQWSTQKKSLLIDTTFRDYPTPHVYFVVADGDNVRYVIDGVQRLTTYRDYINDKFALSKNLEPVEIDGATHVIAGKKFSKLDEDCQNLILNYNIDVCRLSNASSKDIREIFSRLNGGKPLSNSNLRVIYMSDKVLGYLTDEVEKSFIQKISSKSSIKSDANRDWIIQAMMLLETTSEHQYTDFRKKNIDEFVHYDMDNVDQNIYDILSTAIDKLGAAYEDVEVLKIPTTSVPMILYAAAKVVKNKGSFTKFVEVLNDFLENYDDNEEYKAFVGSGTSGKESVSARYEYWKGLVKDL